MGRERTTDKRSLASSCRGKGSKGTRNYMTMTTVMIVMMMLKKISAMVMRKLTHRAVKGIG